jgi:glutamate carboxypeptidase
MLPHSARTFVLRALLPMLLAGAAAAAPDPRIADLAAAQKQPLLDSLAQLVAIESGSRDLEGLAKISELIAAKFKALGGEVELIDPSAEAYRMEDTPEQLGRVVRATFKGTGQKKILLIAHMDTVYLQGMLARQPFRIDGDKAYGLGIADDKQGIAVIMHIVSMLQQMKFKDYGTLTVLINGDEEISSPGSRGLITQMGAEHDAVMSLRGRLRDRTTSCRWPPAGIASVTLKVHGQGLACGLRAREAASTRCTSCRTRCCRCATCPTRPRA